MAHQAERTVRSKSKFSQQGGTDVERVADYIMQRLVEAGVRHVFLVTGRGILFLTDALAKEKRLTPISTYHEQGAAYAAMAYAQAKGGVSACLVSTGCAATNAVTTALCAWQDNVPMVFLSGQHMLAETTRFTKLPIRTYGSQEADIVGIVRPITKYAAMLERADDVGKVLDKAFALAQTGRKGPVWIDVPLDVQNARIEPDALPRGAAMAASLPPVAPAAVKRIADDLAAAKRPLFLVGGGVRAAGAETLLAEAVTRMNVPLVFTPAGADAYGSAHARSIGAVGSIGGSRAGNFALQHADCILVIGTKLCSQVTGVDFDSFAPGARIKVVDIDAVEHTKREPAHEAFLHADAADFLRVLLAQDLPQTSAAWRAQCAHWKAALAVSEEDFVKALTAENQLDLYAFSDALSACLPPDAAVITDAGLEELIVPAAVRFGAGQRCLFPAAQGAMGYAVPAALGAHFAGKPHIAVVVGDGSILMNMQELYILAAHGAATKIFVINNDMYAVIRKRQRDLFRNRTIGNDPSDGVPAPDFSAMAGSVGIGYARIEGTRELPAAIEAVLQMEGMVLCEVLCTPDQKYLHRSYGLNEKRRLEYRPFDDLSPFMERKRLNRERQIDD